ncbi:hypothetical protein L227DRAFT_299870 [Lentinus tigrinus ALCF2SS1-6]|uniref:Uncharacterized protein n=1 Tax=Lentinus tigrinus ALCF2SS1-6 TaxID=1328759 RepID=A0A5C2RXF1_9APHY|nr:hypothetical protein L227DRAFT_299870 [Lentinus tigrinus ALCF2SS1-6]
MVVLRRSAVARRCSLEASPSSTPTSRPSSSPDGWNSPDDSVAHPARLLPVRPSASLKLAIASTRASYTRRATDSTTSEARPRVCIHLFYVSPVPPSPCQLRVGFGPAQSNLPKVH